MKKSSFLGVEECAICANEYDRDRRLPTFVCRNQHTVCGECLEDIIRKAYGCPFCREPILPRTTLNLDIFTRLPERGRAERSRLSADIPADFRFNSRPREEGPAFQAADQRRRRNLGLVFGPPIRQGQLDEYLHPPFEADEEDNWARENQRREIRPLGRGLDEPIEGE